MVQALTVSSTFKAPLAFVTITSLACATTSQAKEPRVKGDRLVFALPDLEGKTVRSSDPRFEGKVLFVTLWGTWCPPCRSEIPTFNELQQRYSGEGLVIVGIAFERDTTAVARRDRLREFSQKHRINYLVLDGGSISDFSTALPMVENVNGLPIGIVINRSGVVVDSRNGYGYKKRWARRLESRLRALLSEEK
jgi:thiol-disulfide isomerase/thioredoxin